MNGIDLCCQQHDVNWKQVKQSGQVDFIIPRTGWGVDCDGDLMDPKFLEYVKGARENGISIPGVFHFIYVFSMDDAVKNAMCAVNAVKTAGLPKSTIIWCDQEEDTVIKAVKHGFNLTTKLQRKVTEIFCEYVKSHGYSTGVYLNRDYLKRVYGEDITTKYDIWYEDHKGYEPDYPCLYRQYDWHGRINGIPTDVDRDVYIGIHTGQKQEETKAGLVDKFCDELQKMSNQCIPYYGEGAGGIGCSAYLVTALQRAGVIKPGESFWAGQYDRGVLTDKTRFQRMDFNPATLKRGDILYYHGVHTLAWDGINGGVWEGAPKSSHGVCDNGVTGVGHRTGHGYRNCGNGTYTWTDVYRIIDPENVKHDAQEEIKMDKALIAESLAPYMPVIKNGYKGDIAKGLQKIMAKYGWYSGTIDGDVGPFTVAGIRNLQTALGVDADGNFGPKSWTALLK